MEFIHKNPLPEQSLDMDGSDISVSSVHTSDLFTSQASDMGLLQCMVLCLCCTTPDSSNIGWRQQTISDPKLEKFTASVGQTTPLSLMQSLWSISSFSTGNV